MAIIYLDARMRRVNVFVFLPFHFRDFSVRGLAMGILGWGEAQ